MMYTGGKTPSSQHFLNLRVTYLSDESFGALFFMAFIACLRGCNEKTFLRHAFMRRR